MERALILIGLVNLGLVQEKKLIGDGHHRYLYLNHLLSTGELPDGDYSLIGPIFATPLWLLEKAFDAPMVIVPYYNIIFFCAALAAFTLMLRHRVEPSLLHRFLLLLISGSFVAAAVNDFYGEIFTLVAVGAGLMAAVIGRRGMRAAGWTAVVLGAANIPASLVGLGMVSTMEILRRQRLRILVVVVAGTALVGLEIWLRNGGYEGSHGARTIMPYSGLPRFSYPFVLGVAAILFSFGRGLLFFLPGLALPAYQRLRQVGGPELAQVYRLWVAFTAGLVVLYASWWAWHGGWTWGPRFFLFGILPASLVLAARIGHAGSALADLLTLAALGLSVWGAISSAVYYGHWPKECYGAGGIEELCHFTPEFSQLWVPILLKPPLDTIQSALLAYYVIVFLWLAAPVAGRLYHHTRQLTAGYWQTRSNWRF